MGLAALAKTLDKHRIMAIDSCVLIYYLEMHEIFGPPARAVMARLFDDLNDAVISTMALAEVLVGPYRRSRDLGDDCSCNLQRLPNCRWVPMTCDIADVAAELRAQSKLQTPDAVRLATAIESDATLFVTNDHDLPTIEGIEYLMLGE